MTGLSTSTICITAAFAFYSIECSTISLDMGFDSNFEVKIVESLAEFLQANPNITVQQVEREEIFDKKTGKFKFFHRVGNRISGDRILAADSANKQWSTAQDFRINFTYPKNDPHAFITYLEVVVDQSSNEGSSAVIAGGIGQKHITFMVEAKQTFYFRYRAAIYGY